MKFNSKYIDRPIKYWATVIVSTLLIIGIAVSLEVLSYTNNYRIDLTPEENFTISDQSVKILKLLEKDITFTAFYQRGDRKEYNNFFRLLSNYSKHIKYQLIDLDRFPGQAKLHGVTTSGQTISEYQGRKEMDIHPTEENIINTILKFIKNIRRELYFTTGHDEKRERGQYLNISQQLKYEGWSISTINLATDNIPAVDNTLILIPGPQKDFFDHELNELSNYLKQGGKIVILLEPYTKLPNLMKFLKKYRILTGKGIIIDIENKLLAGDYLAPLIPFYANSPITKYLKTPSIFPTAMPIFIDKKVNDNSSIAFLAKTSDASWAKTNQEDVKRGDIDFVKTTDIRGPLTVAVMVMWTHKADKDENEGEDEKLDGGALVCFSDSDFIQNQYVEMMANKDLFLNTLNFLNQEKDLISVRTKKYEFPFHHMTNDQGRMAFIILVVVMPLIFIIIGIIIFVYRKWRG